MTTPEIIDQIHELILEDRRISGKSIAEKLVISRERVVSIIHKDLDMGKLSAKSVPKCLNADQKRQRCQSSEQLWNFFSARSKYFLSRLVTMDETWLYHYDPETKKQSMEWRHSGSPRPKNSEYKNPLENFSTRFFGIKTASSSLIIFQRAKLSKRSITHLCWCKLKDILKEKRRRRLIKGVLFLHDNAPSHRALATQKIPANQGFQCLDHPRYSPHLDPSDYHLLPGLKKQLKGCHFSSDSEVIAAVQTWLDGKFSEVFFLSGLQKLEQRAKKCIELRGEHVK